MIRHASLFIAGLSLTACGASSADPAAQAKVPHPLTMQVAADDAANAECSMFTREEVAKAIGEPVNAGTNTGGGQSCQWLASDGTGDVILAVIPAVTHGVNRKAPGFRAIPEVGPQGFVSIYFDGFVGGAIKGDKAIRLSVNGAHPTTDTTAALLRDTYARLKA